MTVPPRPKTGYWLNRAGNSIGGKAATKSQRKVLKSSPWAHRSSNFSCFERSRRTAFCTGDRYLQRLWRSSKALFGAVWLFLAGANELKENTLYSRVLKSSWYLAIAQASRHPGPGMLPLLAALPIAKFIGDLAVQLDLARLIEPVTHDCQSLFRSLREASATRAASFRQGHLP